MQTCFLIYLHIKKAGRLAFHPVHWYLMWNCIISSILQHCNMKCFGADNHLPLSSPPHPPTFHTPCGMFLCYYFGCIQPARVMLGSCAEIPDLSFPRLISIFILSWFPFLLNQFLMVIFISFCIWCKIKFIHFTSDGISHIFHLAHLVA